MTDPAPKRRLPVLQASAPDEQDEDRPAWHWSGIGVLAIFLAWLPLAYLGNVVIRRLVGGFALDSAEGAALPPRIKVAIVAVSLLGFVVATLAGGYLVGRFGARAGTKEAAVSGLLAAAIAWALTAAQAGVTGLGVIAWLTWLGVMSALGAFVGYWGGRLGLRGRKGGAS